MRSIFFHEDDYCQLEILPIQNYEYCKKEIHNILTFSEKHKVEGGIGWTGIYIRNNNPISLTELNIPVSKFGALMEDIPCKFDTVYTGYNNYRKECQNVLAYGDSDDVVIFCDFDEKSNIVKNIWLTLCHCNESQKESAQKILSTLAKLNDFILVDWNWHFLTKLANTTELELYLSERMKDFYDE
jgi:hypothetical protein